MDIAKTMASAIETLGLSFRLFSSSCPANSEQKVKECYDAGKAILQLLELILKPKDILEKHAFENAITVVIALGGSTNAFFHLIAIARTAGVELSLNDFQRINILDADIADLKPSGQYVMEDLYEIGGVPAVQKLLTQEGLNHADCMTVTGKTIGENIESFPNLKEGQKIIFPISNPIKKTGHLQYFTAILQQRVQ